MRDFSNTEHDAGLAARADAYPIDDRDHDEPGLVPEDLHPATCADEDCERLLCVLGRAAAQQKAALNS